MHLTLSFVLIVLVGILVLCRWQKATGGTGICGCRSKADKAAWRERYGKERWGAEAMEDAQEKKGMLETADCILNDIEAQTRKLRATEQPRMSSIPYISDGMTRLERGIERVVDICISALALVLFSPLFLFCYILIKLDDGGTVIYRQERIGRYGRPFYIYKFRSMQMDTENDGPQLSFPNGENDDRLTKAGRFLRAHHLDELPQLWNVFCGDMAFIGYRPERLFYIEQIAKYDPRYYMLYQIRPGVTSYATLYNGYTDTIEKMLVRLELDLYYLKHHSWWFDLKILFLTFWYIIGGKRF